MGQGPPGLVPHPVHTDIFDGMHSKKKVALIGLTPPVPRPLCTPIQWERVADKPGIYALCRALSRNSVSLLVSSQLEALGVVGPPILSSRVRGLWCGVPVCTCQAALMSEQAGASPATSSALAGPAPKASCISNT